MFDGSTAGSHDQTTQADVADRDVPETAPTATDDATPTQAPTRPASRPAEIAEDEGPAELQQIRTLRARIAELERTLADERDHAADYMRRWQGAQADFSNFKRRATQDQEQRNSLLAAQALAPAIVALDSLERAFLALPPSLRGFSWIEGIALVELQLRRALELQGIHQISVAPGQPFDPAHHDAIGEIETTEHPVGHVVVVVQQGYETQGRLIRPALVQVARFAAPSGANPTDNPTDTAPEPASDADESEPSRAGDDAQSS